METNQFEPPVAAAASPESSRVPPWNSFLGVVYIVVIFFVSQVLAVIGLKLLDAGWNATHRMHPLASLDNSVAGQFLFILLAEALSIAAVYAFVRAYGAKLSVIGLRRPKFRDLVYGLAAVPVYYLLYILTVGVVSSSFKGLDVNQAQDIGFSNVHGPTALVMTFISLAILPPLAEEIMVRGFLYSSLKKALPVLPAVVLTSAIFAAAHLPEGGASGPLYIAALDTFVLSLVLIFLREKTGSLWASITLHAIKNSVAFVALFVLHAA